MARLRIGFRGAETVVALPPGTETTVGRSKRATIHLPDPELAPVHFRIRPRSGGFQLRDDGSGIGTRVNGRPVFATTLRHGDVIEAGGLRCTFLVRTEATPPPRGARAARPAAREAPAPPPAPPSLPRKTNNAAWIGGITAGVAALALAYFLLQAKSTAEQARALWVQANEALDRSRFEDADAVRELEAALAALDRIRSGYPSSPVASPAAGAQRQARAALDALNQLREEERSAASADLDEEGVRLAFARIGRLRLVGHPAVARQAQLVEEAIKQARVARTERAFAKLQAEAANRLAAKDYAGALAVWRDFSIPGYLFAKRAENERLAIRSRIASEYRGLLRLAARNEALDARIGLLEAAREVFAGTPHADDLEVRISALRARRGQRRVTLLDEPKPERGTPRPPRHTEPEQPATPETEGAYEEPPKVSELVRARRFAKAAALLPTITRHPDARTRGEELAAMATLLADLAAAIEVDPAKFTGILLPNHLGRADAAGADAEYVRIRAADGSTTRYAWGDLPPKAFPKLLRQAGLLKPPRLGAALLLDEAGLANDARRAYVACFEAGQDSELLARIVARRRGIPVPEEGFVVFRNDLMTAAQKEHLLLLDRIRKLAQQGKSTLPKRREEAWAALEAIGEPALETLTALIRDRREAVAAELKGSRAFSAARFVQRFGAELRRRREEALAFIRDPRRYPYPNKTKESQEEAERLVDAVREIWDKPFERLLETSTKAQAIDGELRALDARLAKLDPLLEPLHETVADEVRARLDVRRIALDERDRKRIEYNFAVEKYNRELKGTTADEEERANVTAVNRYRHMMGLYAVKIDERLVRAARKHSIEMRQLDYFAHDSPTPHLKSPTQRAQREGYPGSVSENIARGASSGEQAFWQWFRSSGHHRNMVIAGHTDLGCGSAQHHWWTQNFGHATGRSLDPPAIPPDPDPPGTSGNGQPAPGAGE